MTTVPGSDQTDVTYELAYERRLALKALVVILAIATIVVLRQLYLL